MILYILLIAHFLADFSFQSTKLAEKKINKFKFLIIHSLIYAGTFCIAIFPFVKFSSAVLPYIIIITSHFCIDWIRTILDKKFTNRIYAFTSFIIDQIFHIVIIVVIYYIFSLSVRTNQIYEYIGKWVYFENLIIYSSILVIIWDPVAVFIKKMFSYIIDKQSSICEDNDPQIGRIIGKLERVIIASLVLCNQFGAIGFVLTAKSIARYKQLEDRNFAEKYLVGTLTSAIIAFITTIILKQLL